MRLLVDVAVAEERVNADATRAASQAGTSAVCTGLRAPHLRSDMAYFAEREGKVKNANLSALDHDDVGGGRIRTATEAYACGPNLS